MGKKKIDRLSLIENKMQRNVAFCKRKRGFLKKAIELSQLCAQNILVIIHDEEKNRVVEYASDHSFTIKRAYEALKRSTDKALVKANNASYEKFTNKDYQKLECLDFRSVRYKKEDIYQHDDETISELERNSIRSKSMGTSNLNKQTKNTSSNLIKF